MKKTLAIVMALLLLLSAVLFASCESNGGSKNNDDTNVEAPENAEDLLEKISASMEDLKSCTIRTNVGVSVEMTEESMTISNETTAYADIENQRISATSVSKIDGESVEISFYLDPDVYMIDVGGEKYMGQIDDSLSNTAGEDGTSEDASIEGSFDAFEEVTMENENGGYRLTIKGIKDVDKIIGLLVDSLKENFEGFDEEMLSFLSDALKGVELTIHTDNKFYLTSAELSMSMTIDMEQLMEQVMALIFGGMDFDFGSGDFNFDFDSEDFDFDFDFDDVDSDFDFDFDDGSFDIGDENLDFELGEITVTLQIGLELSDFDAAANKVVKPSTEGYEEFDLTDIFDMSTLI